MATGTGKTWVMHALLLWQLLNARREDAPGGCYTRHFLIVAPGLLVYDRLLDAYMGRLRPRHGRARPAHERLPSQRGIVYPARLPRRGARLRAKQRGEQGGRHRAQGHRRRPDSPDQLAPSSWRGEDDGEKGSDEARLVRDLLPIRPGTSGGNALDTLDRQYLRGNELEYLASLPDLLVINDEAHHIHEHKTRGEVQEVEWQKGLNYIAAGRDGACSR